jgi:uncharacterized iron-regulated membrane protein
MKLRTLIFWPHLVAGVAAGIVILLMCVTGVLLTYERQFIAWSDRHFVSASPQPGAAPLPLDELVRRAAGARPEAGLTAVMVRPEATAPVRLSYGREAWYADAYTGALLGPQSEGVRALMSDLRAWHRWIGMEGEGRDAARAITGWSNVIFLFIVASGIYLWVPRTIAQLRQNLWFRGGLRGKARDFNWHNVTGVWVAVPLFIVVISATPISFPGVTAFIYERWGDDLAPAVAAGAAVPAAGGAVPVAGEPAELQGHLARVAADVPAWTSITVQVPDADATELSFAVDRGDGGQPQLRSTVAIDRASGALTHQTFEGQAPGRRLRSYMRFGHTGEVLGLAGQTVAGVATGGGAVLVWTGLALAWRRFRAWLKRRRDAAPVEARVRPAA